MCADTIFKMWIKKQQYKNDNNKKTPQVRLSMIVDAYIPSTQESVQEDSMSVKPVQTVRILDYVGYIMKSCFKK